MEPFVSVIIPVYNRANVIGGCLDSLMEQSYPSEKIEIIIADDGSTDHIKDVAHKYPVKLVRQPHTGMPAARNLGIKHASGEIIVFFDDDTIVDKDWIKSAVEVYAKYDNVGGVTGKIKDVPLQKIKKGIFGKIMKVYAKVFGISGFFVALDGIGEVLPTGFTVTNFHEVEKECKVEILSGCNMSFHKKAMEEVGLFDNEYIAYYDDHDYSCRVSKKGYNLYATPKALVDHLVTPVNREELHRVKYHQLLSQKSFFYKNVYEGSLIRRFRHLLAHAALFFPILVYSILGKNLKLLESYIKAELKSKGLF